VYHSTLGRGLGSGGIDSSLFNFFRHRNVQFGAFSSHSDEHTIDDKFLIIF